VQGTPDLLILKTIALEPKHGWAILKRIQQISHRVLQVRQGSLYPAFHRLGEKAWTRAAWAESGPVKRAKFNSFTAAGCLQPRNEAANWGRLSAAVNLVVQTS
jgi:PadR family transcriptional regulator, regulatory protein PadR